MRATIFILVLNLFFYSFSLTLDSYSFGANASNWFVSVFMHLNFIHLLINSILIYSFGKLLSNKLTWYHILNIYFSSGLIGSWLVSGICEDHIFIGSSGAATGLIGAALILMPNAKIKVVYLINANIRWVSAIFLTEIIILIIGLDDGIAHLNHLFGYIIGFILGWIIKK